MDQNCNNYLGLQPLDQFEEGLCYSWDITGFSEFQGVINTRISADSHPSIAINKIMTHYEVLSVNQLAIPESLKALIILSKLPPHYNFVAQDFLHNTEMSNLDAQKIENTVVAAWDVAQNGKLPQLLGCGNVLKLLNVKQKFLTSTFQNQQ